MTSPALTLISHRLCPFVQRAAIVLREKEVSFERIDIDLADKPDWFLAISPTGKVPLLKVGGADGSATILFESVAICEYLDETQPGPNLHPADPLLRAQHRAWVEFATATLLEAWPLLNAKDADTAQAKRSALRAKLERVEDVLGDGPYFAGNDFTMVDAVFAPIFRFFDSLDAEPFGEVFADLPRVAAWRDSLRARPSVAGAVSADFRANFQAHLKRQGALIAA